MSCVGCKCPQCLKARVFEAAKMVVASEAKPDDVRNFTHHALAYLADVERRERALATAPPGGG